MQRKARKHDLICLVIVMALGTVLVVHMAAGVFRGAEQRSHQADVEERENAAEQETTERRSHQDEVEASAFTGVETVTGEAQEDTEAAGEGNEERPAVFDSMSMDYGDAIEGFVYYEIPEEYQNAGGYFPEDVQKYAYFVCKQYGVRYDLLIALIERESGYVFDKVGDDGHSIGYTQIYEEHHTDRMERLNCDDLTNPYQNILVAVDYLAELYEKYRTWQDTLTAYNYGARGAYRHLWSKGIYVYPYNEGIMRRMKEIEEELQECESEK